MKRACWLLAVFYVLTGCRAEEGLEFPTYDGKDRVIDLSEKNYKQAFKKYDMVGVLLHEPVASDKISQRRFQMTEMVLEVSVSCMSRSHSAPWGGRTDTHTKLGTSKEAFELCLSADLHLNLNFSGLEGLCQ